MEFLDRLPAKNKIGRPDYMEASDELKKHPGKWAVIDTKSSTNAAVTAAYRIKRGLYAAFRDGEYEASTRGKDIYVRYIGPRS